MEALLTADFEIGHFFRESIIPRAVLYFTGEALEDDEDDDDVSVSIDVFFFSTKDLTVKELDHLFYRFIYSSASRLATNF